MSKNKAKRQYTGCACRCGQGTWGTYAPGHDAKHVSQLVAYVVSQWGTYETSTAWRNAIKQLGSYQLQWKFRKAMTAQANKHRAPQITEMTSLDWQTRIHLTHDIRSIDQAYDFKEGQSNEVYVAIVAAAMGMTRHSVNMRHS